MNEDIGTYKKPCHTDKAVSIINGTGYPSKWASLPVSFDVLDKLVEPIDHVRFAAVCKGWCLLSKEYNHTTGRWRKVLPMLMIPTKSSQEEENSETNQCLVYSVYEGHIFNNIQLSVCDGKKYCGSSHGWLAVVDQGLNCLYVTLMDPFRKYLAPINLSGIGYYDLNPDTEDKYMDEDRYMNYLPKVILSADPYLKPKDYWVVLFYQTNLRLCFYKAGQRFWSCCKFKEITCISDAVFYKGQVYTVGTRGKIVLFDIKSKIKFPQVPKATRLTGSVFKRWSALKAYLVESTKGDLWHVRRTVKRKEGCDGNLTDSFQVYKVVFDKKDRSTVEQVEVKSIGDEALFVGDNHSMSFLASNFAGCQPNSIYYTCDLLRFQHPERRPFDMAVYNLENETITPFYSPTSWQKGNLRAAWICPQFNGLC
ncbi:F-box protein At2g26160-like [Malus domestica]|uniref:F-box protein At2g26160-like n=1 Tax=Malus domestica TaxID=3750 RepID=UPI0010AB2E19|nr:F-box protein At2g26160-like [Malus domestica]